MTATDHLIPLQPCHGCGLPTVPMSNPCTACRRAGNPRGEQMNGNPIRPCLACQVHVGAWPPDGLCPGCRNAGRMPEEDR